MIENNSKSNSYLAFRLHKELFAVSIDKVLEVLLDFKIVSVPDAPIYIAGMLNFRGDIIPVINFKRKFNFPEETDKKKIVIVIEIFIKENSIKFGAIVDGVKDVFDITEDEVKKIPEFGSKYNPEYLTGMIVKDNLYFMLLDIEKVFTDKEITVINETIEK